MPRRREAKALVGPHEGQVGRIEALGVKNVQIGLCDVLISFGDHKTTPPPTTGHPRSRLSQPRPPPPSL